MEQQLLSSPIGDIATLQSEFLATKLMPERKSLGQFFTSPVVSEYMASLVQPCRKKRVRILDAGAGTGILTASTAFRCLDLGCSKVHAVVFEIDQSALPSLRDTMRTVANVYAKAKKEFTYEIKCEDFVLARPDRDSASSGFDVSVINPPYFKYSARDSQYSKVTSDLYGGDPNIYASFMAVAMASLNKSGQLIAITPRSYTNGLYFKPFRCFMLGESMLELVHIFKQRGKLFKNEDSDVLQENIICRFRKGCSSGEVIVRSSDSDQNIERADEQVYPSDLIIDASNNQNIIRIPDSELEANLLKKASSFSTNFTEAGYFISTGRVVEHRTRSYITSDCMRPNSIPLYRPHNITIIEAKWSGDHPKDVSFSLDEGHEKHTMKNGNYVVIKRFTSKDEKRRLVAAVHLDKYHNSSLIGFGNKTNYVGVIGEVMRKVEAFGLAAVFNSSFMDRYFRSISGNTQVNATEVRVMKFPSREQVLSIGKRIERMQNPTLDEIDSVVNPVLAVEDFMKGLVA